MHTRPGLKEKLVDDIKSRVRTLLNDTDKQIEMGPQAAMYGMVSSFSNLLIQSESDFCSNFFRLFHTNRPKRCQRNR